MPTSTLTSKNRITVPKEVRDRLGVQPGDRLLFVEDEHDVYVIAATKDVRRLKGLVATPKTALSIKEMNRLIRKSGGRR